METKFNAKQWSGVPSFPSWANSSYQQDIRNNDRTEPSEVEAVVPQDQVHYLNINRPLISILDNTLMNELKLSAVITQMANGFIKSENSEEFSLNTSATGLAGTELSFYRGSYILNNQFVDFKHVIYNGIKTVQGEDWVVDLDLSGMGLSPSTKYYIQADEDGNITPNTAEDVSLLTICSVSTDGSGEWDTSTYEDLRYYSSDEGDYMNYIPLTDSLDVIKDINMSDKAIIGIGYLQGTESVLKISGNLNMQNNSIININNLYGNSTNINVQNHIDMKQNNLLNVNQMTGGSSGLVVNSNLNMAGHNIMGVGSYEVVDFKAQTIGALEEGELEEGEEYMLTVVSPITFGDEIVKNINVIENIKQINQIGQIIVPLNLTSISTMVQNNGKCFDIQSVANIIYKQETANAKMTGNPTFDFIPIVGKNLINDRLLVIGSNNVVGYYLETFELPEYNGALTPLGTPDTITLVKSNTSLEGVFGMVHTMIYGDPDSGTEDEYGDLEKSYYLITEPSSAGETEAAVRIVETNITTGNIVSEATKFNSPRHKAKGIVEYNNYIYVAFSGTGVSTGYGTVDKIHKSRIGVESDAAILKKGTISGISGDQITDSSANFQELGVLPGQIIYNTTSPAETYVVSVDGPNTLTLDTQIFSATNQYALYAWINVFETKDYAVEDTQLGDLSVDELTGIFYVKSLASFKYLFMFKDDGYANRGVHAKLIPTLFDSTSNDWQNMTIINGYLYANVIEGSNAFTIERFKCIEDLTEVDSYSNYEGIFALIQKNVHSETQSLLTGQQIHYFKSYENEDTGQVQFYTSNGTSKGIEIFNLHHPIQIKRKMINGSVLFGGAVIENVAHSIDDDWVLAPEYEGTDLTNRIAGCIDGLPLRSNDWYAVWAVANDFNTFQGIGITRMPKAYFDELPTVDPGGESLPKNTIFQAQIPQYAHGEDPDEILGNPLSQFVIGSKVLVWGSTSESQTVSANKWLIGEVMTLSLGGQIDGQYVASPSLENLNSGFSGMTVDAYDLTGVADSNSDAGTLYCKHIMTMGEDEYTATHKLELYSDLDRTTKVAESDDIEMPVEWNGVLANSFVGSKGNMDFRIKALSFTGNLSHFGEYKSGRRLGTLSYCYVTAKTGGYHYLQYRGHLYKNFYSWANHLAYKPWYNIGWRSSATSSLYDYYKKHWCSTTLPQYNSSGASCIITWICLTKIGWTETKYMYWSFTMPPVLYTRDFTISEVNGSGISGTITANNADAQTEDFDFEMKYSAVPLMDIKVLSEYPANATWAQSSAGYVIQLDNLAPYVNGDSYQLAYPKYKLISKCLRFDDDGHVVRFSKNGDSLYYQITPPGTLRYTNLTNIKTVASSYHNLLLARLPADVKMIGEVGGSVVYNYDLENGGFTARSAALTPYGTEINTKFGTVHAASTLTVGIKSYGFIDD